MRRAMRVVNRRIALAHHQPRLASGLARGIQFAHHVGEEQDFARRDSIADGNRRVARATPSSARCACRSSPRSTASDRQRSSSETAASAPPRNPTNRSLHAQSPTSAEARRAHRRNRVPFNSPLSKPAFQILPLQAFQRRRFAVAIHQPHEIQHRVEPEARFATCADP